jgi:hypothetical protein
MAITLVERATSAILTTRETVKRELGLTSTDDDILLSDMIVRASSAIERETRRSFGVETVTETLDGTGTRLLGLARTPIVEITSITEDETELDADEYSIEDADAGAVYRADGWGRSGGLRMWGTEAYSSGYILPGYRDLRYSVTYRAGYLLPSDVNPWILPETPQNLPGAVEQAAIETVKSWYIASKTAATSAAAGGEVGAISSVQVGALRVGYGSSSSSSSTTSSSSSTTTRDSLPASALGLLRNYYARPLS